MTFETAVALANCVIVPIVGWLLRNSLGRFTDRLERVERQVIDHEEKIDAKVSDEEWLRESMRLRNDVQRMGETLARIEGKTDSTLMLATSVNRVAAALEKTTTGSLDGQR